MALGQLPAFGTINAAAMSARFDKDVFVLLGVHNGDRENRRVKMST